MLCIFNISLFGQLPQGVKKDSVFKKAEPKPWYNQINIRGYVQFRYHGLYQTNNKLTCEQCDRSMGGNGGFAIRRGRIIFSGQLNNNVYFYIQPDFGNTISTSQNVFQIRDAYLDLGIDKKNEYRIRLGQSKVPYGFENTQSSSNRLTFDRSDGINSAAPNERELGAFFYWAPEKKRSLFAAVLKDNYKGSGDYGAFALGVYNGSTTNRAELNSKRYVVSRFTWPTYIGKQIVESSLQAYTGKFVIPIENRTTGVKGAPNFEYIDQRAAASLILYPKPFGIQAEYNVGKGPSYNKTNDSITTKNLDGGYILLSYKISKAHDKNYMPFTRLQYYNGGKKQELDARAYKVTEWETGIEWQVNKFFEFTIAYTISQRQFEDSKLRNNKQKGSLIRLQTQLNF